MARTKAREKLTEYIKNKAAAKLAEKVKCPHCTSGMTYFKKKTRTHQCRKCGYEWSADCKNGGQHGD